MSIFDQFDDTFLPGDKSPRKVDTSFEEYEILENKEEEFFIKPRRTFWYFYFFCLAIFFVLIFQLLNLQITHGSFHYTLAEGNRIRQRKISAPRGLIYDNQGKSLVNNDASFSLELYPLDIPKKSEERKIFFTELSKIIQIPPQEIKGKVEEKGYLRADPVILKENIDRNTAILLETKVVNFPGVVVAKNPIRKYADIKGLSQVLGYVGKVTDNELKNNSELKMNDTIGKDGLEKSYNNYLKGRDGYNELEVDSIGRVQRFLARADPAPGDSISLSLDSGLQEKIVDSLSSEFRITSSSAGAAVAINPKDGGVLGMVSLPTYDNNIFTENVSLEEYQKLLTDDLNPMFNRAVSGTYPSGSTIKPVIAAAGLQEGVITENTTIDDPGQIQVGNWIYPDWKNHGLVNVRKAISESCNVFFYAVGGGWDKIKGLGVYKLKGYMEKFGLGETSGIDLPGETKGLVPSPEWKEEAKNEIWYLGDTYHMAIGQGDILATPLQMANLTAVIANGGELLKPHLVNKITDKDGSEILKIEKEIIRSNFVEEQNIQIVREGMRQSVTSGSSKLLNTLPEMAAAKTGTAQYGNEGKTHAWMIAFAPYNDPQIAIAVIVEGGGEGHAAAAPVVNDILYYYFTR